MNDYTQYALVFALLLLLYYFMKSCTLRKWFGLVFLIGGLVFMFILPGEINDFDTFIFSTGAYYIGLCLFFDRHKFRKDED
jgi:hypothetical protein